MGTLRCPDDGHVLQAEKASVPFWLCRHCSGLWFPRESMELRRHAEIPAGSRVGGGSDVGATRTCPACAQPLTRDRGDDVVLDVCGQCGGVWLDPGEYPAALRRAAKQRMKKEFPSLAPDPPGPVRRLLDSVIDLVGEHYIEHWPEDETLIDVMERRNDRPRRRR